MFSYSKNVQISSNEYLKVSVLATTNYSDNTITYIKYINNKSYSITKACPTTVQQLELELEKVLELDEVFWKLE